jgi:hypothetical protein
MTIRSNNDPRYSRRFLFMGIAALGFMFYCLYDGIVRYPAQRQRAHDEFIASGGKEDDWGQFAKENEVRSEVDIQMQFIMAAVAGSIGLLLISIPLRMRGRWIEADETGITSSWGQSLKFDQITGVNKRKWRDKGIAKVAYIDDNGRKRRFVIDDFKFERYPTDDILYELEQRIDPALISGGPPEAPREEGGSGPPAPVESSRSAV